MSDGRMRTIVITGASSGIGRELALQLAVPGNELWLIGRNEKRLTEVVESVIQSGASAKMVVMDLAEIEQSQLWLEQTFGDAVAIDEVFLAAAESLFGEVKDMESGDWHRIYQTNFVSPMQWADFFYKRMRVRKAGRIIFIGSLAAYAGYPTATAYASMKAGILGYYKSIWPEAKMHGVHFHLVSPGYVETGIYQTATYRKVTQERVLQEIRNLGFKMISAKSAAASILRGMERNRSEFAFPAYASCMKWISPRLPWMVTLLHKRFMSNFHKSA